MNLPALSAEIVHRIRNSIGDSAHNQATMVQNLIAEAMTQVKEQATPKFAFDSNLLHPAIAEFRIKAHDAIASLVRIHNLSIESLTEAQCTEAIVQAFQCGDFKRLVRHNGFTQQVVYVPFAECERLKSELEELKKLIPQS